MYQLLKMSLLSCHLLRCLQIKHISLIQHQMTQSQEEEALSIQQPHHCKWCGHQQLTFINITKTDTATSKQALVLVQIQMKLSTTTSLLLQIKTYSSSGSWTFWALPGPHPAAHWWDGGCKLLYCPPGAPARSELSPSPDTGSLLWAADKEKLKI